MTDTQTAILAPSTDLRLAQRLMSFEQETEISAQNNLREAIEAQGGNLDAYTQPEIRAMVKLEQLKLLGAMGLAEVLLRGKLIREIENEALWSIHPTQYNSMQEAAKAQGISVSEYSNIRALNNVVFPYLVETLGLNLALIWEEIGKSNFRELVPLLTRIITGETNTSRNVEEAYERIMDDIAATNAAANLTMNEDELRQTAVEQLLEAGQLPNRELRERIRPERTPSIPAIVMNVEEDEEPFRVIVTQVTQDQWDMLNRRMNGYIDFATVPVRDFARTRLAAMLVAERQQA